jgi:hypothetical protein
VVGTTTSTLAATVFLAALGLEAGAAAAAGAGVAVAGAAGAGAVFLAILFALTEELVEDISNALI